MGTNNSENSLSCLKRYQMKNLGEMEFLTKILINLFFYQKILKYLIPVLSPHIAKSTKDAIITPIILDRYR